TIEGPMIEISLRQFGASKIKKINGEQYYIEFSLDKDYKVAYAYNINGENEYFLQRVLPYPMHHGVFDNEKELVTFIEDDITKFRNAIKSSNFEQFVNINNKIQDVSSQMEALFLNYNVDSDSLLQLDEVFNQIIKGIHEAETKSKKIEK
ncbi:MAG: hypothetical protein RSC99_07170, partial [Clostridiales bacterium]